MKNTVNPVRILPEFRGKMDCKVGVMDLPYLIPRELSSDRNSTGTAICNITVETYGHVFTCCMWSKN